MTPLRRPLPHKGGVSGTEAGPRQPLSHGASRVEAAGAGPARPPTTLGCPPPPVASLRLLTRRLLRPALGWGAGRRAWYGSEGRCRSCAPGPRPDAAGPHCGPGGHGPADGEGLWPSTEPTPGSTASEQRATQQNEAPARNLAGLLKVSGPKERPCMGSVRLRREAGGGRRRPPRDKPLVCLPDGRS